MITDFKILDRCFPDLRRRWLLWEAWLFSGGNCGVGAPITIYPMPTGLDARADNGFDAPSFDASGKNIGLIGILINGVLGHPVETLTLDNICLEPSGGGTAENSAVRLLGKESAYSEFNMFGKNMPAYSVSAGEFQDRHHNVLLQPDARPDKG
ncbi:MAG: hypothetical protein ACFUZC_17210 [Chthoniobacteraceae bacterium]